MPSFYPSALPRQMPPTPPDYYDSSSGVASNIRQLSELHVSSQKTRTPNYELGWPELPGRRPQHARYNLPPVSNSTFPRETHQHGPSTYSASTQGPSNLHGVAMAPLLPPIRIPDHHRNEYQQDLQSKRASSVTKPKEEKGLGGVSAHLTYNMEDMVDFVSETAQGMYDIYGSKICLADIDMSRSVVDSRTPVPPDFRKFVSQMLSSTRLPISTIFFGLHYLATRMTLLSMQKEFQYGNSQIHRMLTIALLLGSKFLDDNTFQNRSWSEVSNIPVSDLNVLELEWLTAIDWNMHIDPKDPQGFMLWFQQWGQWLEHKVNKANRIEPLVQSFKHTHLHEGTVPRQQSFRQLLSPTHRGTPPHAERLMSNGSWDSPHWIAPLHDSWPPLRGQMAHSPPSAPETGPNTPEWYESQNGFGFGHASYQTYSALKLPAPLQIAGVNPPQPGYHKSYAQQYNTYSHGSTCPCGYCMSPLDALFMGPGYGPQTVMG